MTENQRLKTLFIYLRENKYVRNQQDFVERIGSDKSTVSQILNERISVPNNMFGNIVASFPFVSEPWLRFEKGEMLKPSVQQTSNGAYSPNVNGDGNNVNAYADFDRFLKELAAQRRIVERTIDLLEKRDEQIDRLISIFETQK